MFLSQYVKMKKTIPNNIAQMPWYLPISIAITGHITIRQPIHKERKLEGVINRLPFFAIRYTMIAPATRDNKSQI